MKEECETRIDQMKVSLHFFPVEIVHCSMQQEGIESILFNRQKTFRFVSFSFSFFQISSAFLLLSHLIRITIDARTNLKNTKLKSKLGKTTKLDNFKLELQIFGNYCSLICYFDRSDPQICDQISLSFKGVFFLVLLKYKSKCLETSDR